MMEIIPVEHIKGIGAPVMGCSGPTDSRFAPAMSWRWLTLEKRCHQTSKARTVGAVDSKWVRSYRFRGFDRIAAANLGGI